MKKICITFLLFTTITTFSQKTKNSYEFGAALTQEELKMVTYEKDTTATAVVLYEEGSTVFFDYDYRGYTRNTVYKKIKILKKEGAKHANIKVHIYNSSTSKLKEKIEGIRAITHNGLSKKMLSKNAIYTKRINETVTEIAFTLPDVQAGSIIEYTYEIESPFLFYFTGWDFQDEIPKKESVFKAEIPGNYLYNRKLVGQLRLDTNTATIKKKVF